MEQLKLEDFFSYYVQYDSLINSNTNIYQPENSNLLYNNINLKQEFVNTKLPLFESFENLTEEEKIQGKALKHQEFMSRFMSPNTPYNKMLVFHEVGTGKCVFPGTKIFIFKDEKYEEIDIESLWKYKNTSELDIFQEINKREEWLDISKYNILTKSYKDNKIVPKIIIKLFRQIVKETIIKITTTKSVIKCTKLHKFAKISKNNEIEWADFSKLSFGDTVLFVDENNNISNCDITFIETQKYEGLVYDLEVEDVHNYVANNLVSHNTCLLANVSELARKENKSMDRILVLVRGQTIKKNIIKEISTRCFKSLYEVPKIDPKTKRPLTQETIERRRTRLVNSNYQIETFFTFSKRLMSMSDEEIQKLYSNRFIFVDEAHRLRDKLKEAKNEKVDIYKQLFRFFHVINNVKILLMTGTPMKDKAQEIVPLLNLLLPIEKQMNVQDVFTDGKPNFKLLEYCKGIVSYVRQEGGNLVVNYIGSPSFNMKQINTVRLMMGKAQTKKYMEDYNLERIDKIDIVDELEDDEESDDETKEMEEEGDKKNRAVLYKKSISDSLFVYPEDIINTKLISISGYYYKINEQLQKYFLESINKDTNLDERNKQILKKLKKCSIKYEFILKDILNHKQKSFIFSNVVSGTGTNLLSALFNLFGYEPVVISGETSVSQFYNNKEPALRYALLTGNINDSVISKIVDIFKHPKNINGEYLQVIIGSSKISEGISFYETRNAYILTPYWNNTETLQAIGRVIRKDSHDRLPQSDRELNIYRLAAIPDLEDENESILSSIDMIMYKRSEDKDIQIKAVERYLKSSAIDCVLNRERNFRLSDKDGSKECDYQECDYKCLYVDENTIINTGNRIYDTYNLLYGDEVIKQIKTILYELFLKKFSYDFDELYSIFRNNKEYNRFHIEQFLLIRALKDIIYENVPIYNKYGFINFLREDRNFYFLVDDPRLPPVFTFAYYTNKILPKPNMDFGSYVEILNYKNISDRLDYIIELFNDSKEELNEIKENISNEKELLEKEDEIITKTQNKALEILDTFDKNIKDLVLRQLVLTEKPKSIDFKQWYLDLYRDYIIKVDNYYIDFYLYYIDKRLESLKYINHEDWDNKDFNGWMDVTDKKNKDIGLMIVDQFIEFKDNSFKVMTTNNPFGYYAKITDQDELKIVKILKRLPLKKGSLTEINKAKIPSGKVCGTGDFSKGFIQLLYVMFGIIAQKYNLPKPYPKLSENQKINFENRKLKGIDNIQKLKDKLKSEIRFKTFLTELSKEIDKYNEKVNKHNTEEKDTLYHELELDPKDFIDVDNMSDYEELKRLYMLSEFNEVKGPRANLCPGLKYWFSEVGYSTRF